MRMAFLSIKDSVEMKIDFDRDRHGDGSPLSLGRSEAPRADRCHGIVIQSHADRMYDPDVPHVSLRINDDIQAHHTLYASLAGCVRIAGVGVIQWRRRADVRPVGK